MPPESERVVLSPLQIGELAVRFDGEIERESTLMNLLRQDVVLHGPSALI